MKENENICLEIDDNSFEYYPIAPEIVQTSNFKFKNFQHYVDVNANSEFAYTYTRGDNPTIKILEDKLARLEGGQQARAFASGMGAISGTVLSLIKQNDHIIIVNTVYGSSVKLIQQLSKFGVESTKIDVNETKEIFDYIQENTKMIYFESPSSQKFAMLDLELIARVAKEKEIYTVIDNTWATPLLQNPLNHGIDVVIHSCSKYIGGHSDIVGGVVITNESLMQKIDDFATILLGATMSPINAWLAIRGLRTLPVRLKSQNETIIKMLDMLKTHPKIEKLYHPYINDRDLASRYLNGYGSLFGVVLKEATPVIIEKFVDSLKHFTLAYSWGGFESLIMPVYKGNNLEELKQRGLAVGQLRVYLGLEDSQLLIDDFVSALNIAYQ